MVKAKTKRISVQSAKAKAKILQKWVCEQISLLTGFEWGSSGDDMPIESRPMGQSGCDVRLEKDVRAIFPFSVECKWQETWSVPAWIEQSKKNKLDNTDWLLFIKRSRKDPVVVLEAKVFFELLKRLMRK